MTSPPGSSAHGFGKHDLVSLVFLSVVAWLTLFHGLGEPSINTDPFDESIHTGVTLELADTGRFKPTWRGHRYLGKPPLKMWLTARLVNVFGVDETVLRIPDATAGLLSGLILWGLARAAWGPVSAVLAPTILWTSLFTFFHGAREGVQDAGVTLAVTVAVAAFIRAAETGRASWYLLAGAAMATGTLVKSVVALLPIGIGIGIAVLSGHWRSFRRPWIWISLALPLATYGFYSRVLNPDEFQYNVVKRGTTWKQHVFPWWEYLLWLAQGFHLWTIPLALGAVWGLWSMLRRPRSLDARVTLWLLGILVPFSLAVSKLPWYIYPLYPAAALLTARALTPWEIWRSERPRWRGAAALIAVLLAGFMLHRAWTINQQERTSMADRLLTAAAEGGSTELLLYDIPRSGVCPDEEFYLQKLGFTVTEATPGELPPRLPEGATLVLPEERFHTLLKRVPSLQKRGLEARLGSTCHLWGDGELNKTKAPNRVVIVLDRQTPPKPDFEPITPVFLGDGFYPAETVPEIGQMEWMGPEAQVEVGGSGTGPARVLRHRLSRRPGAHRDPHRRGALHRDRHLGYVGRIQDPRLLEQRRGDHRHVGSLPGDRHGHPRVRRPSLRLGGALEAARRPGGLRSPPVPGRDLPPPYRHPER